MCINIGIIRTIKKYTQENRARLIIRFLNQHLLTDNRYSSKYKFTPGCPMQIIC